jgi:translin
MDTGAALGAVREETVDNLDSITDDIRRDLTARDEAREQMLPLCRDAIRFCSQAIRAIHRQEFPEAADLLGQARQVIEQAAQSVAACPDLGTTGILRDAQKELAEGHITLSLVSGHDLPTPAELHVEGAAYLNGLGEAVGEVRRYVLDSMRQGDLSRCEELLAAMDDIYSVLVTMDYPDALTGGLRRTTDMVRGVLERTRSDLTLAIQQKALEQKLAAFENRLRDNE